MLKLNGADEFQRAVSSLASTESLNTSSVRLIDFAVDESGNVVAQGHNKGSVDVGDGNPQFTFSEAVDTTDFAVVLDTKGTVVTAGDDRLLPRHPSHEGYVSIAARQIAANQVVPAIGNRQVRSELL